MGIGFKERLRDACITAGIAIGDACSENRPPDCQCCADLAQRCGCSMKDIERWIDSDGDAITGEELLALRDATHTRGEYLLRGQGPMTPSAVNSQTTAEAIMLLEQLTPNEAKIWLRYGHRLQARHRSFTR